MVILNRTVFDVPLTWNRIQFESTRNKYRIARKLIEHSINVQFEKQMKGIFSHNIDIDENINDINEHLIKYHDKLRVLDNMIELASQSLRIYFDKRMENVRHIVNEHCNIIQQIIHEEAEHWKEIHAVLDQNLLNPGDIRSRNNYPRAVQKSPASNIETIEEEEDVEEQGNNEQQVSKLLNGKTLTPLLTQMIRKSRLQSKRLTIVPSIKISVPIEQENSVPRKEAEFSMHILPLSTTRRPLEIVDTTFVVKPDDTIIDYDEPNGTYRAPNQYYHSHLPLPPPDISLLDSQPNIPARLCFSPTILQEATILPEDNADESSLSDHEERFKTVIIPRDQNRTSRRKPTEDMRRFGQTFLLDNIKTEQIDNVDYNQYKRPAIPDDDVLIVKNINPSEHISLPINKNSIPKSNPPIQKESTTIQEIVLVKSRTRTTKTKSKPVLVSARKTRSATKVIAEQEAAVAAAKVTENKRKTRKRKQSRSIDHAVNTSDDENIQQTNSTQTNPNKRKTKKRKKSKTDHHVNEISDDENNRKRSKSKRNDKQQEISNDNKNEKSINSIKHKKSKVTTDDNEEKQTKTKTRKKKTKKSKKDDEEQSNQQSTTRSSSSKRNHRSK